MEELALHLLDLIQNSVEAGASIIGLSLSVDGPGDWLKIVLSDNGRGMDEATCKAVFDPFYTTRKTRRVGLGLPLIRATAEGTGGYVTIASQLGIGTTVTGMFGLKHLDCPPLGDLATTLTTVICSNPDVDFRYRHERDGNVFELASSQLRERLGDVPLGHPEVWRWLQGFLAQEISILHGGAIR